MFRKKLFVMLISLVMVSAFIPIASFAGNTDETAVNSTAGSMEEGTSLESEPNSEDSQDQNGGSESPAEEPTDSTDITEPVNVTEPPQKEDTIMSSAKTTKGKSVRSTAGAVAAEPGYELTVVAEEHTPLAMGILDSHCCIIHLIMIILALAAMIVYVRDMKIRQARIFELQKELEEY